MGAMWTDAEEARLWPEKYRHVACPDCHAEPGQRCKSRWGDRTNYVHVARLRAAREKGETE